MHKYAWPGNVRELQHLIERMVGLCQSDTITADQLPDELKDTTDLSSGDTRDKKEMTLKECVEELTLRHMREHLNTGAIVLECTNLEPFTGLIQKLAGVTVFGVHPLLEYIESRINPTDYC